MLLLVSRLSILLGSGSSSLTRPGTGWQNCEIREFVFTEKSTQSSAHVVEKATLAPKPKGAEAEPEVVKEVEDVGLTDQ